MITDQLQFELERYYSYGNSNYVRYTHRLRIDQIGKLIIRFQHRGPARPKALDAGCGYGVYSIMLAEAGYDVFAIDINQEELKKASEWAHERGLQNRIMFQLGDIQKLEHDDAKFDLIVCSDVLEHLDNPIVGARELYRILKSGGRAIISMPNMASLFGALQSIYRKSGLRSFLGNPPLDLHQLQHSRYWFGNIISIIKHAGFHIDYTCSTSHVPFLWDIENFVAKRMGIHSVASSIDELLAKLPFCRYFGFNFISLVSKHS
jgi:2-polyprenyl-3-methyl-5-hydroxy-6-metoxy-1,4-benzoquinol methylase